MSSNTAKKLDAEMAEIDGFSDDLKPGTKLLGDQYAITKFLNSGGFGITYLATDSLDRTVVIKECYPEAYCRRSNTNVRIRSQAHESAFSIVLDAFVGEARAQAKLVHPNIVNVQQVFNDNETAYMAMDYVDGSDLLDKINGSETLDPKDVEHWLRRILDAIGYVHSGGVLHRDISPDNILVGPTNEPVLIDFGAAREEDPNSERVLSTMRVIKDGYSPQEFYVAGSTQSPSSDLYALGATFYHVVTGEAPPDSQSRLAAIVQSQKDIYEPLAGRVKGYPKGFMSSIDMALSVLPKDRMQSAEDWIALLDGKPVPKTRASGAGTKKNGKTKKSKLPMLAATTLLIVAAAGAYVMTTRPDGPSNPVVSIPSTSTVADIERTTALEPKPTASVIKAPDVTTPKPAETIEEDTVAVAATPSQDEKSLTQVETVPVAETAKPAPIEITADSFASPSTGTPAALPRAAEITKSNTTNEVATSTDKAPTNFVARSEWTAQTPFETSEISVKEGTFALVSLVRPDLDPEAQEWLKSGTIIYAVNGILVYDNESIARAIAQSSNLAEQETATVELRVRTIKDGPLEAHMLVVLVARSVELENGFRFAATHSPNGWETRVARVPVGSDTTLHVGDVIVSEALTNTVMQNAEDMELAMSKLGKNSAQQAYFTITRKGKLDSATLSLISQ